MENRFGRMFGGVVYDYGDFLKIVLVYCMIKRYEEFNISEVIVDCYCDLYVEVKSMFEDVFDVEKLINYLIFMILGLFFLSFVWNFGIIMFFVEVLGFGNNLRLSFDYDENEFGMEFEYILIEDENVKVS